MVPPPAQVAPRRTDRRGVDAVSLISTVFNANQSAAATQRQTAIAANAIRSEQATMNTLMEAIQQSASYGAGGQALASSGVGTRFAASA